MFSRNKKKEEYVDTRTIEEVRENEKALEKILQLMVIMITGYYSFVGLTGFDLISVDAAAFLIVFICLIVFAFCGAKRLSSNPSESEFRKIKKWFRVLFAVCAINAVLFFSVQLPKMISVHKITMEVVFVPVIAFVIMFYVMYMISVKRGKAEIEEARLYDETVVRAEIRRRSEEGMA